MNIKERGLIMLNNQNYIKLKCILANAKPYKNLVPEGHDTHSALKKSSYSLVKKLDSRTKTKRVSS